MEKLWNEKLDNQTLGVQVSDDTNASKTACAIADINANKSAQASGDTSTSKSVQVGKNEQVIEATQVNNGTNATPCLAPVNRIIPFSAVDGPGNRTAIFLQGCNIDCKYCHNPETRTLCNNCGACVAGCPTGALQWSAAQQAQAVQNTQAAQAMQTATAKQTTQTKQMVQIDNSNVVTFTPSLCVGCDACTNTCPHGASPKVQWQSAAEVFAAVQQQMPFIRGVTASGGECTLHPQFLTELFTLCKAAGLSTLLDSNGMVPLTKYPALMAVTDGVMLDIKAYTAAESLAVTGSVNEVVLQNLQFLAQTGKLTEIRTVVAPAWMDAVAVVQAVAAYLAPYVALATVRYKLITVRPFGVRQVYRKQAGQCLPPTEMDKLAALATSLGFGEVVVL